MKFQARVPVLATAVALAATPFAQAQIEEVLVTAQKKEAAVTDVPITMTALSSNDIRNLRLTDAMDVEAFVTNIDIKGTLGGTNPAITIRGVGLNDFNANNNPSVGVYVDDVFLVSAGMLNFSTFDIDRIEVLKGPQGSLYGRNTNGGAINYFSTRPTFETEAYVTAGAGNFDMWELEGAVSGELAPGWAYRISGTGYDRGDNYVDNELGSDFDGSDLAAGRLSLLYEGERLDFLTTIAGGSAEDGFQPFKNRGFLDPTDPNLGPCPTAASGNPAQDFSCTSLLLGVDRTFLNVDVETFPNQEFDEATYADSVPTPKTETDSIFITARFDYEINDRWTATAITGYADIDRQYADSVYGSLQGYRYFDAERDEDIDQISQELRFHYLDDRIDLTTGVFYSYDEVKSRNTTNADDALATLYDIRYDQETTAAAAFAQMEYTLNQEWSVEVGARWSYEDREYEGGTTDLNPYNQSVILYLPVEEGGFGLPPSFTGPLPLTAGTRFDFDDDDPSGRLGLNYRPNDDWLIYGNVSTGFKSGIVFSDITFVPEEMGPLDKEELVAYELGFKGTLADGTVQLNGAGFYYDYEDIQTQVPTALALTFTNADQADVYGLEGEITWAPIDGLNIRAGASYLDTEIDSPGLDDNELPNAPEYQFNAIARYEFPVTGDLYMALQGDMKYTDEMYKEATNNPLAQTDDYTIYNARITLADRDDVWEVSAWGKNLGDEDYLEHSFVVDFFGITGDLYNTPRTYGVSGTYRF